MNYVEFLRSYNVNPSRNWVNNLIISLYRRGYSFDDIEKEILWLKYCYGWCVPSEYHISVETKNRLISLWK